MAGPFSISRRFDRHLDTASKRLAAALIVSLLFHGVAYVGWRVEPALSALIHRVVARVFPKKFSELQPAAKKTEPPVLREVPMVFVEVDPARATAEPPKDTKNYSTHNSIAANEAPKELNVPKIDGAQTRVLRVEDVAKPKPQPLQPAPPPPDTKPVEKDQTEPESKPKPAPPIGDLAMTKTDPNKLKPDDGAAEKLTPKPREKPRTLAEARQRNPELAGQRSQQEGGVIKRSHIALDAKGSPFGNYDSTFISIVQERWYQALAENRFMLDRHGKVAVTFRLHFDGRITALVSEENTVGDVLGLLCEKAILDPAPFPKWPSDMRKMVGSDVREVRFTFYYD